jgi:hypothetical protein
LTTAAVALEEQRAATVVEDVSAAKVAPVVPAPAGAPRSSWLILGTLVLAQVAWLGVLGFLAYDLLF